MQEDKLRDQFKETNLERQSTIEVYMCRFFIVITILGAILPKLLSRFLRLGQSAIKKRNISSGPLPCCFDVKYLRARLKLQYEKGKICSSLRDHLLYCRLKFMSSRPPRINVEYLNKRSVNVCQFPSQLARHFTDTNVTCAKDLSQCRLCNSLTAISHTELQCIKSFM